MRMGGALLPSMITGFFIMVVFLQSSCLAYENYTVGDDLGWEDPSNNSQINYSKWVKGKNFTLGDYLLFKYPSKSHNIVATQNRTLYTECNYLIGKDSDYLVYGGEPGVADYAEVPLVKTGTTYFFCAVYDGEHCKNGMRFSINVGVGEGLPASLAIPPPAPEEDNPPPSDSTPDLGSTSDQSSSTEVPSSNPTEPNLAPVSIRLGILFYMLMLFHFI